MRLLNLIFSNPHFMQLVLMATCLCLGAFAFTLEWATNDMESWLFTALSSDASGVLAFRNPNLRPWPMVILVPTDGSMAANGINNAGFPAANPYVSGVTIAQTAGVGAGQGRVLVIRRR